MQEQEQEQGAAQGTPAHRDATPSPHRDPAPGLGCRVVCPGSSPRLHLMACRGGRRCARQLGGDISRLGFDGFLVLSLMECSMIALLEVSCSTRVRSSADHGFPRRSCAPEWPVCRKFVKAVPVTKRLVSVPCFPGPWHSLLDPRKHPSFAVSPPFPSSALYPPPTTPITPVLPAPSIYPISTHVSAAAEPRAGHPPRAHQPAPARPSRRAHTQTTRRARRARRRLARKTSHSRRRQRRGPQPVPVSFPFLPSSLFSRTRLQQLVGRSVASDHREERGRD